MRTKVAIALATVYVVWGSTYLAIAVADRTLPPLLMLAVRFGVAEQEQTCLRRLHAPRATWTVEEALPDDALELSDLLAHGRLRVAELARRGAERPRPRNRLQRGEMAQLDAQPIISAHNQLER